MAKTTTTKKAAKSASVNKPRAQSKAAKETTAVTKGPRDCAKSARQANADENAATDAAKAKAAKAKRDEAVKRKEQRALADATNNAPAASDLRDRDDEITRLRRERDEFRGILDFNSTNFSNHIFSYSSEC